MILHSQKIGTLKIKMIQKNIMLACAEGSVGWKVPNRMNILRNYIKLTDYVLDEKSWNDNLFIKKHLIIPHNENDWEKIKNM